MPSNLAALKPLNPEVSLTSASVKLLSMRSPIATVSLQKSPHTDPEPYVMLKTSSVGSNVADWLGSKNL